MVKIRNVKPPHHGGFERDLLVAGSVKRILRLKMVDSIPAHIMAKRELLGETVTALQIGNHFRPHDRCPITIPFRIQTKLRRLTPMISVANCPLCSMIAAIPEAIPSLKATDEKKPSESKLFMKKLSSMAPSCKPCQVKRISPILSAIKAIAKPMAILTLVCAAIIASIAVRS
jgi:hypothetical protein